LAKRRGEGRNVRIDWESTPAPKGKEKLEREKIEVDGM